MFSHDEFLRRQAEAQVRLRRLETLVQTQTDQRGVASRATDLAADAAVAEAEARAASAGGVAESVVDFGRSLLHDARRAWSYVPGSEAVEAIARDAWDHATRELQSRGVPLTQIGERIREVDRDPATVTRWVLDQKGRMSTSASAPHVEAPRGTLKIDGARWENSVEFPETLYYKVPAARIAAQPGAAVVPAGGTHVSDPELTFLYLDVGRWGNGLVNDPDIRRDFGVVAGRTAAVCEFGAGAQSRHIGAVIPASRTDIPAADRDAINRVLLALAAGGKAVRVVRALASRTAVPAEGVSPDTAYVILGDMHLPVMTSLDMSDPPTLQLGRFEADDAAYRFGLKGTLAVSEAAATAAKRRVRGMLRGLPRAVIQAAEDAVDRLKLSQTGYFGTLGTFNRRRWLDDFRGADIFRDASAELAEFTRQLEDYKSRAAAQGWAPVVLMQLGDMFDLWIGMLCHFLRIPEDSPEQHFQLDGTWTAPTAQEFVDYWLESTLWNTSHSGGITDFLSFSGDKCFLYGNHDNYLSPGGGTRRPLAGPLGGPRAASFHRPWMLFAEHGHRTDWFNMDGAVSGWLITQSAFREPGVRSLEPSSRYKQVMAAGEHWLAQPTMAKYAHYAMGHTHKACLARVIIEPL